MILFKRIGESFRHIEDREWVLLALETLGVLAGILIAFELQEWASNRAEDSRHRQIMERLFEESEQDVAVVRDLRDTMRSITTRESEFATALTHGTCPPASQWEAVETTGMYPSFKAPRSVYEELMGAGGLSTIRELRVREAVARFNLALEWSQSQNEFFRSKATDVVPIEDPRVSLTYNAGGKELLVATYDHAALCSDHRFRNQMASAARNHLVIAGLHDGVTQQAIAMCGALARSLGHRCVPVFGGPLSREDADSLNAKN